MNTLVKKLLPFFLFFTVSLNLFSAGGNVFHGKKLFVIKTEYFDIIYSPETSETAKKVAEAADDYYLRILDSLGSKARDHFIVSISREVENFNGFSLPLPYNMIVLYDAYPESPLDCFEDHILSTFYHELTHAVTMNLKTAFWRGFSFFANVNPILLNMNYTWLEGTAVMYESMGNGGRLKNPFFNQLAVQAKIDSLTGKCSFPSWRDVSGARDTSPGGNDRYVFGGLFVQYLIDTYGMQKFSLMWKNSGGFPRTLGGNFKKTYGISISQAWKDFEESIPVPELLSEKKEPCKLLSANEKSMVQAFDIFDGKNGIKKIAWYDSKKTAIFLKNLDGNKKTKKVLGISNVKRIVFSPDGNELAVTYSINRKTVKNDFGVLNLETGKFNVIQKNGAREAYFKNLHEVSSMDNDFSSDSLEYKKINVIDDYYVSIVFEKSDFKIKIESPEYEEKISVKTKDGYPAFVENLHLSTVFNGKAVFSFTWAPWKDHSMELSRPGFITFDLTSKEAEIFLYQNYVYIDGIPHGIRDFAFTHDFYENYRAFVIPVKYESNPLYEIKLSKNEEDWFSYKNLLITNQETETHQEESDVESSQSEISQDQEVKAESFKVKKYARLSYIHKGIRLPAGTVPFMSAEFDYESVGLLGVTLANSSPWFSSLAVLSGGYDPFLKAEGVALTLHDYDESIDWTLTGTAGMKDGEFYQSYVSLSLNKTLWRGLIFSLTAGISGKGLYGKDAEEHLITFVDANSVSHQEKTEFKGLFGKSTFFINLSNVHRAGHRFQQYSGFYIQPFLHGEYKKYDIVFKDSELVVPDCKSQYLNSGITAGLRIPFILPVTLEGSLYPETDVFVSGTAKLNLFSIEVQKGIPFSGIFLNRIAFSLSYTGNVGYYYDDFWDIKRTSKIAGNVIKDDYYDSLSFSTEVYAGPNFGALADPMTQCVVSFNLIYRPVPEPGRKKSQCSVSLRLPFLN